MSTSFRWSGRVAESQASYRLHRVTGLLLDADLRAEITRVGGELGRVALALGSDEVSEDEVRADFERVVWACDALFDRIAIAMRNIYEGM